MTKHDKEQYQKCIDKAHGMCELCGRQGEVIHHVYGGMNRDKSTKYGLLAYLCVDCHDTVHSNYEISQELRRRKRKEFQDEYPTLKFMDIFRRNF